MRAWFLPLLLVLAMPLILRAQTEPASPRLSVPLMDAWQFHKGDLPKAEAPETPDTGAAWQSITLPHTWNAQDGQDGGNNYYRGDGWYRRHLTITPAMAGKSLFLRFQGANRKAWVYLNGKLVGDHAGGESAFCFNITSDIKTGDNLLAVRVSNRVDQDMPPLQADFTFFGGIYRPVELIAVSNHHFSLTDFSSAGVYITTPEVTTAVAKVHVRAQVERQDIGNGWNVTAVIRDASGKSVATATAGESNVPSQEVNLDLTIPNPHLWNGRLDPYLYSVQVFTTLKIIKHLENTPPESIPQPLGIRTVSVDPARGFILNGKPYDLHGVDRHQDRLDKGWAISDADQIQDMALIKEMGCTAVRLAHYQQSQFFYYLCDKEGLVVWAEIPVVDRLGASPAFTENARQQYTELIRQNYNHPSICFWSCGNEVDDSGNNFDRNGPQVYPWFKEMSALGHKEDPTRLTTSAWREKFFPPVGTTDVFGLNEYLGWYTGGGPGNNSGWEGLETYIARHSDTAHGGVKGMWAISEYGAGSSIYFHSEHPVRMDHTEEYQSLLHENTWHVFSKHPEIWGKFIWNMFDFAVDSRREGDHAGRNDKGLVTYDRKVKKDAFYFYKAVWSEEPVLYLTSKRFTVRGLDHIPVKLYTNAPKASLTVNGVTLPEKSADNGTIVWENVQLKTGANEVTATALTRDGHKLEDTATWTYTPGAPLEVYEPQDQSMKEALKAGPPRAR